MHCISADVKEVKTLEENIETIAKFQKISESRLRAVEAKLKDNKDKTVFDCPSVKKL